MTENQNNNRMSRRRFVTLAGGAAGMAVLASTGLAAGWGRNQSELDPEKMDQQDHGTDVLVIGGGMAGLFAAVKAHDAGANTMLVSKGRLGASGQTPFAKGIFAYDPSKETKTLDEFVDQVSLSAMGTNNPAYTRQMAEHSLSRVNELKEWGFFNSPLCNKSFIKPINERRIPLMERIVITHLIKENDRIAGAAGFSLDEETVHVFQAKSVILCTGAGGFKPNGFPICDLTHDGTVMAYNIGAKVTGKEWNDGHPGQAENPAACFDGWHGMFEQTPGTTGIEVRHDLGVDGNYQAYMLGNPVSTGPGQGAGNAVSGGPQRPEGLQDTGHSRPGPRGQEGEGPGGRRPGGPGGERHGNSGPPPGMGVVTVGGSSAGMAIHKAEGLVPINDRCESNIPGLYAAGDALGSYMAGGIYTQIGSSLAGSAVQGAVAGEAAGAYSREISLPSISGSKIQEVKEEILAPLKREAGYGPAWVTQTLQGIMIPNFILYILSLIHI